MSQALLMIHEGGSQLLSFLGPTWDQWEARTCQEVVKKSQGHTQAAPLIFTYIHSMCVYFYTMCIVCVHVCIYTFTFVYLIYIYIYIYIYTHAHIHTYMYVHHHSFKFQKHCRISEDCLWANHHFFPKECHTYRRQLNIWLSICII